MTPTCSRALLFALACGVALTHLGCSYELVLETVSGRTTFEQLVRGDGEYIGHG